MARQTRLKKQIVQVLLRLTVLLTVSATSVFGISVATIPDQIAVRRADAGEISAFVPLVTVSTDRDAPCFNTGANTVYEAKAKIFGVAVKDVTVNVYDDDLRLYPGGQTFGIRMNTRGVVVVGISEVETDSGKKNPAIDAGLRVSDVIRSVNGVDVNSVDEVMNAVAQSEGQSLKFRVEREGASIELSLCPAKCEQDGFYRAGLWIRDSTAGIGTMTYINPEDMSFGGLGHGVCDADTGELMPLGSGTVFSVTVSGIVRGAGGCPGEIKGYFNAGKTGLLTANSNTGVYGVLAAPPENAEPVEIALHDEIKSGPAVIRCALDDGEIREYSVQVEKLPGNSEEKNMVIHVTDQALLEKTGGIIQGMSGSPIMQDGKLIGAVTHVLINDPTCGYGIFIENMLEAAA